MDPLQTEKLAIYEETCYEWVTAEQACYTQSFIVLTVYANLGLEALAYALDSAHVEFIVANGKLLSQLVSIKDKIHLKYVIYTGDSLDQEAASTLESAGIKILSFDQVMEEVSILPNLVNCVCLLTLNFRII